METKKVLITGITGQDGRILARQLLEKGNEVYGLVRKVVRGSNSVDLSVPGSVRGKNEVLNTMLIHGDVRDILVLQDIIDEFKFDEIYHLASQSDVAYSFKYPNETYDININGTLNLLNAVHEFHPQTKVYFAGSSEMFGQPANKPQSETYPMKPRSPYAVSKLSGYWSSKVYREAYGMFVSCGILYNHESEIRGTNFVTRKITAGIARYLKTGQPFELGNLEARKDWGYAPEYTEGMWKMLQQNKPDDFILATNEQHTVQEFLVEALRVADLDFSIMPSRDMLKNGKYDRDGTGRIQFVSNDPKHKGVIVTVNKQLYRPSEADNYQGNYNKAKNILGWEPKTKFKDLVKKMMKSDLN